MASTAPWKAIALRKQAERTSRIPKEWLLSSLLSSSTLDVRDIPRSSGILSPLELEITESHDATSLVQAILNHKYTSEAVTTAFCKRAAVAQQVCNCLTEIFFQDAIERARFLDQEYARTGKPVGPLHGLPISLKDTFKVKGYDSSIGIASLAFKPATENSHLVDILLENGAILYCKTNIPQTLMALDSDNNVFGRVMNPRNRLVTAGGSSGGEGALVAMRGSLLGVGTDIGGSIRIPAMCNGLYGFKPSAQRVPYIGQENGTLPGANKIGLSPSAGPITTSLRDCELFLKSVSASEGWDRDPNVAYGHWEEQGTFSLQGKKPLIGIIRTDGIVTPLPPINTILSETAHKLISSNSAEIVEIPALAFSKCQSLTNAFFGLDGAKHIFSLLSKTEEPLINWLSTRLRPKDGISMASLVELHAKKEELEKEMLKIWRDPKTGRRIDAIILPVAPHPVPAIDSWNGVGYTSSFVLLDYPAGVLPVRDFERGDLKGEVEGEQGGSWDKANKGLWNPKTTQNREIYLNTTLSIQVIAPRLQERRLFQAMEFIDGILKSESQKGNGKARL